VIRSFIRILAAVIAGTLALFAAGTIAIRQPLLTRAPFVATIRADPATLQRHVEHLTTRSRSADRPDELAVAARYIADSFRASGAPVDEQVFTARGGTYRNVIASFGPRSDAPLLVVGAHYDAFGDFAAADDNASGTAGLLELARLLAKQPPARPVVLVAFANEEPPFFGSQQMGSAVHAESIARRPVAGMICLEMIGTFEGAQAWDSEVVAAMYPDRGDFIGVAGGWADRAFARRVKRAMAAVPNGPPVLSFSGPRQTVDASDHRNYWARGWPAVMVTDTAYLRNPRYHTAADTADKLDYVSMARVVDGVFNAVLQFP
jgi:Zn-dependent M28 family amino/carboxypeptidase